MKNLFLKIWNEFLGEDAKKKIEDIRYLVKNFIPIVKKKWPAFKKKAMTTEGIIKGAIGAILIFFIFALAQSCTPRKGGIIYGICHSFLELHVPYPETIRHNIVEEYRKAVRIYYTHVDGFGQFQSEIIECSFYQDPEKGVQVESILLSHIKAITEIERVKGKGRFYAVQKKYIDLFNNSRSPAAIIFQEPDLELP